jgi:hypothetical protein
MLWPSIEKNLMKKTRNCYALILVAFRPGGPKPFSTKKNQDLPVHQKLLN